MKTILFQCRFVSMIQSGIKTQTIRKKRKRPIVIGDCLSLRFWTGKPYVSKQCEFAQVKVVNVSLVQIGRDRSIFLDGNPLTREELEDFAHVDGFKRSDELFEWFFDRYGYDFKGVVIQFEVQSINQLEFLT